MSEVDQFRNQVAQHFRCTLQTSVLLLWLNKELKVWLDKCSPLFDCTVCASQYQLILLLVVKGFSKHTLYRGT